VAVKAHKEETCGLEQGITNAVTAQVSHDAQHKVIPNPYAEKTYGSWMIVKKPIRRSNNRQQAPGTRQRGHEHGDLGSLRERVGRTPVQPDLESAQNRDTDLNPLRQESNQNLGSRFRALADLGLNMEIEDIADVMMPGKELSPHNALVENNTQGLSMEREVDRTSLRQHEEQAISPRRRHQNGLRQHEAAHDSVAQHIIRPNPWRASRDDASMEDGSPVITLTPERRATSQFPMGLRIAGPTREIEMTHAPEPIVGDPPDDQVARLIGPSKGASVSQTQVDVVQHLQVERNGGSDVSDPMEGIN